jgi:hypothetical protein
MKIKLNENNADGKTKPSIYFTQIYFIYKRFFNEEI